jgi:SPP1 family predicted phage head-tail adaptor
VSIVAVTETRQTDGTLGQSEITVIPLAWASIEPLRGTERFLAQQVRSAQQFKITIDVFPGVFITPKHRVKQGARTFDINEVANWQEREMFLELICTEHH